MAKLYASLTGPLINLYFPCPADMDERQFRAALNSSKLKALWCAVYTPEEIKRDKQAILLPDEMAGNLDYDYARVFGRAGG